MARVLVLLIGLYSITTGARELSKLYDKTKFKIGNQTFDAYIADTDARREQGLMFVEKMPEDTGMLFLFEQERPLAFWMKNTLIPLAIAFVDAKGKIVDIQEMEVADSVMAVSIPSYSSKAPAQFALEMNKGWFARHKLKVGDRLTLIGPGKSNLLKALRPSGSKQTRQ